MVDHMDTLRRLAMNDEGFIERVLSMHLASIDSSGLDTKTHALVRLGALIGMDAGRSPYQWNASRAFAAGATVEEIVGVLIAVAPSIGLARIVSAAPEVALAVGYDIDAAFEADDEIDHAVEV